MYIFFKQILYMLNQIYIHYINTLFVLESFIISCWLLKGKKIGIGIGIGQFARKKSVSESATKNHDRCITSKDPGCILEMYLWSFLRVCLAYASDRCPHSFKLTLYCRMDAMSSLFVIKHPPFYHVGSLVTLYFTVPICTIYAITVYVMLI